jgi:hypothetical protein
MPPHMGVRQGITGFAVGLHKRRKYYPSIHFLEPFAGRIRSRLNSSKQVKILLKGPQIGGIGYFHELGLLPWFFPPICGDYERLRVDDFRTEERIKNKEMGKLLVRGATYGNLAPRF